VGSAALVAMTVFLANILSVTLWLFFDLRSIKAEVHYYTLIISDIVVWAGLLFIIFRQRKTVEKSATRAFVVSLGFILLLLLQAWVSNMSFKVGG
jgi:hypothetical protein